MDYGENKVRMQDAIKKWNSFRDIVQNNIKEIIFNSGLTKHSLSENKEFVDNILPEELYNILCLSDGQTTNSTAIFIKFGNSFMLKENIIRYRFLPLTDLIQTYNYMLHISKGKVNPNFVPFAIHDTNVEDRGSISLTMDRISKGIYITNFYEHDRYRPFPYSSTLFADNLNSFLGNQILWYDFMKEKL